MNKWNVYTLILIIQNRRYRKHISLTLGTKRIAYNTMPVHIMYTISVDSRHTIHFVVIHVWTYVCVLGYLYIISIYTSLRRLVAAAGGENPTTSSSPSVWNISYEYFVLEILFTHTHAHIVLWSYVIYSDLLYNTERWWCDDGACLCCSFASIVHVSSEECEIVCECVCVWEFECMCGSARHVKPQKSWSKTLERARLLHLKRDVRGRFCVRLRLRLIGRPRFALTICVYYFVRLCWKKRDKEQPLWWSCGCVAASCAAECS